MYGKQKRERLRKRVDSKTKPSSGLTIKSINEDKSILSSHFKLQAVIIEHGAAGVSDLSEKALFIICKAYGIEIQTYTKKSFIKDKLCDLIPSQTSIVFPDHLKKSD